MLRTAPPSPSEVFSTVGHVLVVPEVGLLHLASRSLSLRRHCRGHRSPYIHELCDVCVCVCVLAQMWLAGDSVPLSSSTLLHVNCRTAPLTCRHRIRCCLPRRQGYLSSVGCAQVVYKIRFVVLRRWTTCSLTAMSTTPSPPKTSRATTCAPR